jgi:putative DNA primase/helicase
LSTGYNYVSKHTKNHKKLLKFLEDIQPNKNDHDYLLTYISTAFLGNTLELFTVLTGNGRNGKSKFIQLLERVFGDYNDTIKSQLLTTQMKDGDSPSPALLSLGHKRLVVASETLEGTRLNTGFIKFITGRDTVKHRYCHRNDMVSFAPNFVILLVCNDIPECDNMDIAFSKRLRCINFPTEFVDRTPEGPNQKHKDDNINMYFDDWKEDFFLLLITYYKRYENDKTLMYPTENVLKWTEQYKENTDVYLCFLNECTTESYTHIKSVVLYEKFKEWFIRNNPRRIIPTHRIFSSGIRKYVTIENVRIDNKITKGIKNLEIKLD